MATLALSVIGNAIAPGVGGFIGASVGAVLDSYLFAPPAAKGPRLDSLPLGSSSEGSPVFEPLGTMAPVPGTNIWVSPVRESKKKVGGKGGPATQVFTYSVDVAIELGIGPVQEVSKLYANGKLVYDNNPDVNVVSNQISVAVETLVYYTSFGTITLTYGVLTSPNGGPNLSAFRAGKSITISGWSTSGNNGTFKVVSATLDKTTGISKLKVKNSSAATDAGGETVTLNQVLPKFSPKKMSSVTIYLGSTTQGPDSLMESFEGTGNVPGYHDKVTVLIHDLQLQDFGNSLPQWLGVVKQSATDMTAGEMIATILGRAGWQPSEYDVTGCDEVIHGYSIRGPLPIDQKIAPILVVANLLTQEDFDGKLKFFPRPDAEVVAVDPLKLAAHDPGESVARPAKFKDTSDHQIPSRVSVTYTEPRNEWQDATTTERRRIGVYDDLKEVDLRAFTMTNLQAKTLARRILAVLRANSRSVEVQLPPSYGYVVESDVITFPVGSSSSRALVTKTTRGANGLLEMEAIRENANALEFTNVVGEDSRARLSTLYVPPDLNLAILDLPPLRTDDVDAPGYYVAACVRDPGVLFMGGSLFESDDSGASYTEALTLDNETTMGRATTTLANGVWGYWDYKNTVTVVLDEGELSSASELAVLAGQNWCVIGQEILAFQTATLTATRTYVLSGLLRGRRATRDVMGTHVSNEQFILLSDTAMWFKSIGGGGVGAVKTFAAVAVGGLVADADTVTTKLMGANMRPFPPCNVVGTRDASNNLTIRWTRRSRVPVRLLAGLSVPLGEEVEKYEIEMLNGVFVVVRTVTVVGATSIVYTAAEQTADGLTPGNPRNLNLYQISSLVGRSKVEQVTV